MKRGYRLNSHASFNKYMQSKTANFYFGQGIVKAGIQKLDDVIAAGGRKIGDTALRGMDSLAAKGKESGLRVAGLSQLGDVGNSIVGNADKIRKGVGIGLGATGLGLGGYALANRNQQPRMY